MASIEAAAIANLAKAAADTREIPRPPVEEMPRSLRLARKKIRKDKGGKFAYRTSQKGRGKGFKGFPLQFGRGGRSARPRMAAAVTSTNAPIRPPLWRGAKFRSR